MSGFPCSPRVVKPRARSELAYPLRSYSPQRIRARLNLRRFDTPMFRSISPSKQRSTRPMSLATLSYAQRMMCPTRRSQVPICGRGNRPLSISQENSGPIVASREPDFARKRRSPRQLLVSWYIITSSLAMSRRTAMNSAEYRNTKPDRELICTKKICATCQKRVHHGLSTIADGGYRATVSRYA